MDYVVDLSIPSTLRDSSLLADFANNSSNPNNNNDFTSWTPSALYRGSTTGSNIVDNEVAIDSSELSFSTPLAKRHKFIKTPLIQQKSNNSPLLSVQIPPPSALTEQQSLGVDLNNFNLPSNSTNNNSNNNSNSAYGNLNYYSVSPLALPIPPLQSFQTGYSTIEAGLYTINEASSSNNSAENPLAIPSLIYQSSGDLSTLINNSINNLVANTANRRANSGNDSSPSISATMNANADDLSSLDVYAASEDASLNEAKPPRSALNESQLSFDSLANNPSLSDSPTPPALTAKPSNPDSKIENDRKKYSHSSVKKAFVPSKRSLSTVSSTTSLSSSSSSSAPLPAASCHQCKVKQAHSVLSSCFNHKTLAKSQRNGENPRCCKKKYCAACLNKYYGENLPLPEDYECPACKGICSCAYCKRLQAANNNGNQGSSKHNWDNHAELVEAKLPTGSSVQYTPAYHRAGYFESNQHQIDRLNAAHHPNPAAYMPPHTVFIPVPYLAGPSFSSLPVPYLSYSTNFPPHNPTPAASSAFLPRKF
jgi:hypothetical protein